MESVDVLADLRSFEHGASSLVLLREQRKWGSPRLLPQLSRTLRLPLKLLVLPDVERTVGAAWAVLGRTGVKPLRDIDRLIVGFWLASSALKADTHSVNDFPRDDKDCCLRFKVNLCTELRDKSEGCETVCWPGLSKDLSLSGDNIEGAKSGEGSNVDSTLLLEDALNSSGLNSKDICVGVQSSNPVSVLRVCNDSSRSALFLPQPPELLIGRWFLNSESSGKRKRDERGLVGELLLLRRKDETEASHRLGRFTIVMLEASEVRLSNAS